MLKNKINKTETELKHNTIVGTKAASYSWFQVPKYWR